MLTVRTYVRGTGAWNMCAEHPNATSLAENSDALTLACKWKWNYVRDNDKTKLHSEAAETGSVRWDVRVFLLTGVTSYSVDGVSVLSDREYTSELADTQSQAYQSLRQEFCSQVNTCTNWGLCDIIIKTLFYNVTLACGYGFCTGDDKHAVRVDYELHVWCDIYVRLIPSSTVLNKCNATGCIEFSCNDLRYIWWYNKITKYFQLTIY